MDRIIHHSVILELNIPSYRIEIRNSGMMLSDLSLDDLKKPHTFFPANSLIANALYLADYAQRAGSGTLEMIEQCRAQGAPDPEFMMVRNNKEFRSILPRDVLTENILMKMGLSERQMGAVKVIKEKGRISNQDYIAIAGLNSRTALRDLNDHVIKVFFRRSERLVVTRSIS